MSAPIVYQGQVQGHGGTLFKDMKFWVAHRVPMRSTWIRDIENNGGSVVQLDKQADFLIADHAKKDVPSGSYSWKWIEESVKNGKLADKEDYSIKVPRTESRPGGSMPQKGTRNAFTKQDDLLLAQFVTRHEKQGTAVSGNVIYKQLESKYPHHTFQSWRDRWVKKLQFVPRPRLSDSSPSPPPANAQIAVSAHQNFIGQPPPQVPASAHNTARNSPPKKTRAKYTQEEDTTLLQYVEEMKSYGKGISGNKIYQNFAEDVWFDNLRFGPQDMQLIVTQFPQHTWQAWRDRYLKQLRPLEANGDGENTPQSSPTRSNSQQKSPAQDSQHKEVKIELQASSPGHPQPLQRGRNTSVESHGSESEDNRNEANPKSLQQPGANRIQSQSPSHSSESDHAVMPSTEAISQSQGFIIGKREDFYEYLRDFRASETQTVDEELNTRPKIQGRHFELWDLWVAVQSQKVEAAERDWLRIAEDIGYNWTKLPTAPEQIMQFYDSYLGEFERLMLRYGGSESEDHAEEDDPIIETPQPLLVRLPASRNVASDGRFDSSPPKQPSLKRPHRSALSSDIGYPDASRKRSRLDPNSEIPSTPDDKNGTLHLRRPVSAGASPSDLQRLVLPKSSQLVRNNVKGKQVEVNSKEMQEEIPETQESHIETQVLTGFPEDTQNDVTPSQQLRSDIDAEERRQTLNRVSPTPRRKVVKSPFLLDEDDGEVLVPQPRYGQGPNSLLSQPKLQVPRRRSPPASLLKAAKDLTPLRQHVGKATPVPTSAHSTQQQRPVERLQPSSKPRSKAEELAEIVEYWMSLGYSQDIARRSLEATTWEPGLAGRIMQMLRDGQSIPANWEGVWTARDDEGLRLIDVVATPIDEKEARKRRKAADRLKDKHGEERMSLRRKWLTVKAEL